LLFANGINKIYNGIIQPENNYSLSLFPNPAHSKVIVKWANSKTNAQALVYNLQGQVVQGQTLVNGGSILVDQLQKGVYLLVLQFNDGKNLAQKIIVE
ncbi:MAG: T9SS type A sorting domain-containing protein, partial [Bacteroidia bacterium]